MSAFLGRGAQVRVRTAPDGAWSLIGKVTAIGGPAITAEPVEVTTLDATAGYKEYSGGLRQGGDLQLACFWINGEAAQLLLRGAQETGATLYWWVTWPSSPTTDAQFVGNVTDYGWTTAANEALKTVVTVRLTGAVDWSAPAAANPGPNEITAAYSAIGREAGGGNWPGSWPTPTITTGASGHGSDGSTDSLSYLYVPLTYDLSAAVHYAELRLGVASFSGAGAATLRVRAVKQHSPVAPVNGNAATYPSTLYTSPGWTTAYRDVALTMSGTGEYRFDVTEIVNEVAALSGGAGTAILFVLEPQEFNSTTFAWDTTTPTPSLLLYRDLTDRAYQRHLIKDGVVCYFWPFDATDLGAQDSHPSMIRAVVGSGHNGTMSDHTVANHPTGYNQQLKVTSKSSQHAAFMEVFNANGTAVMAVYETTEPALRRLFGPSADPGASPDDDGNYGWPTNFNQKSYLWIVQGVHHEIDHVEGWWMDVWGDSGWMSSFWEKNGSGGDASWEFSPTGFPGGQPQRQNRPAAYRNNIGEVKTLVSYYERKTAPRQWHAGYHNGDPAGGFAWSQADTTGSSNFDVWASGFGIIGRQMKQGVLMLEIYPTPRLQHIKQAAERTRKLWAAGVKSLPPILFP